MTNLFDRVTVAFVAAAALIVLYGMPAITEASVVHPSCTLAITVDGVTTSVRSGTKVSIREGSVYSVAWTSQNADAAVDRDGHTIALSGATSSVLTANTNYLLRFSKSGYQSTCTISAYGVSGSVTSGTAASSSKPVTIVGKVRGLDSVAVSVTPFGATTTVMSKNISVRHGAFTYAVPQKLNDGLYQILITTNKSGITTVVATNTLNVGNVPVVSAAAPTTIVAIPVPLLIGGVAHPGATVAVAYLQLINIGLATTTVSNVTLTQSGNAAVAAIVGLTSISDNGVAKGAVGTMVAGTPFVGNTATVPLGLVLAPKEMRLVTIKAITTTNVLPYLGTKITLLVSGIGTTARVESKLPLFGTIWTVGY